MWLFPSGDWNLWAPIEKYFTQMYTGFNSIVQRFSNVAWIFSLFFLCFWISHGLGFNHIRLAVKLLQIYESLVNWCWHKVVGRWLFLLGRCSTGHIRGLFVWEALVLLFWKSSHGFTCFANARLNHPIALFSVILLSILFTLYIHDAYFPLSVFTWCSPSVFSWDLCTLSIDLFSSHL